MTSATSLLARVLMLSACCVALSCKTSNGLLLSNIIGCNSFHCRLSLLESDVAQLKQQMARMSGTEYSSNNNFRPNNNNNMGGSGSGTNNQGDANSNTQPNSNNNQQGNTNNRVSYANLLNEYNQLGQQQQQPLRRVPYQDHSLNGQYLNQP